MDGDSEGVPVRKVVDESKNSEGETLVDFLRGMKMTIVNGRKGKDAFTCVSEKGCSVVDYCIVQSEDFDVVKNFIVTTMSESMVEMSCKGDSHQSARPLPPALAGGSGWGR